MRKSIYFITIFVIFFTFFTSNISLALNNNEQNITELSRNYLSKASIKFMKKDFQGALDCLNEAINMDSNNPLLYLNRGYVNHVANNYEKAMEDYNTAIQINPNYAYAYNNRGVLKVALKDVNGAMEDYNKALQIDSKYSDVYYNKGNLEYMINDLKGALEDYNKAIEYNPKDSEAYNNRGVVKKRLNYNVGALSDYSQAIAINPQDSIAYANRGRLKKLYYDNEGASIDLTQAVALAENQTFIKNVKPLLSNKTTITAIPNVKFAFVESSKLFVEEQKISNKKPEEPVKMAMLGKPTVKQNNKPSNINNQNKQETTTKEVHVDNNSGTTTISAGVGKIVPPTIPDIRTTAVTNNATVNNKLAESYYIRGLQKCVLRDLQGAIADLDKAILNNSKYADAYLYRAAIKKELGDKEGFKKDYSIAIQINPSLQAFNDSNTLSLIQ